ncbi:hypothetical protein CHS0354_040309 [Potamilus streckersoni]|uniref:M-phase phosphoprotein 6 n=1 Tax=Potamilus streckersoni TaxID=2493646 RepID=A0AAE0SGM6_9BIVA|nr:hypothetical protein CHS0354_040309 [Potamilus streckersoni]
MAVESSKSKLSKNVLQMKFMQRSVLRMEKEEIEEEAQKMIDEEHWVMAVPQGDKQQRQSQYIVEPSYSRCEDLLFGRMSFKGCNPEIEKLMKSHMQDSELEEASRKESEIGVDDMEMAERYESLIGTVAKKFAKKRQRHEEDVESSSKDQSTEDKIKKKRKFMKPSDD